MSVAGSALTPSASPSTPALSLVSPKSASVRLMTARLTPSPTTVRLTPSLTIVRLTPSLRTAVRLTPASRPSRPELSHPGRRLLAEAARSPPSRTSTACPPTRCSRDLEATLHTTRRDLECAVSRAHGAQRLLRFHPYYASTFPREGHFLQDYSSRAADGGEHRAVGWGPWSAGAPLGRTRTRDGPRACA